MMSETGRRLWWALGLSLLLHFVLLFGTQIELPQPEAQPTLTVKLENLPRPTPPRAVPAKPKPKSQPPAPTSVEPNVATPTPAREPEPEQPAMETAAIESVPAVALPPPLTPLPKRISIAYALYKGEQRFKAGRMNHTWQMEGEQYTLTSIAEATGLVSLFVRGTLIQVSRGAMTNAGLQPQEFWIQRGQSGDRTESASFDWSSMSLRFGKPSEQKTRPLLPGSQDVLSVLYQLALTAPHAGTVEVALANGRKFDRYAYRVVGEEMLETPLGVLKTEHLARVASADEDKLDVWLAADYHYLPVRLFLVDRKGGIAEQLATTISGE